MHEPAPTILIIDNDQGMVAALSTRLEHYGYSCVTAGTGAAGIDQFRERTIDLVITDLNMPMGDGVEVVKTIRRKSDVPIIVVTGFKEEFARRLRAVPNLTVVRKPVNTTDLIDLVEVDLVLAGNCLPVSESAET